MIKEGILIGGIVFYAFVISTLISDIRDQNFTKSFLRIIDNDDDGIITLKEMKDFNPCPEYDGKKLMREFREYGRRADLNELSDFLTVKSVMNMVKGCKGNIDSATNPDHLKNLNREEIEKELLKAYDLDNDNIIEWSEFNIFNHIHFQGKKQPKNLRQIFRFFDKNHNWRIQHKEIQKSRPKNLIDFLGTGKRK